MNGVLTEPREPETSELPSRGWSPSRWIFCVTFAFAAHIGLIFAFGNRDRVVPRTAVNAPAIQLATGRSELQILDDPTLFALPHPRGFAGASWLRLRNIEFAPFRWSEPPQLMALPVAQLGNALLSYAETNPVPRLELQTQPPTRPTRLASIAGTTALKQRSAARVSGDLANRRWLNAPALLRSWPATDLLTNSVVQVVTDGDGQILSAALMPPGSGSKAADLRALELARSAQFAPVPRAIGKLTVGAMIFEWHAVPVPDTNAPNSKP